MDKDTGEELWELDLTSGRAPENWKDAYLHKDAKDLMVYMHQHG